jgi:hypothetical protein
MISIEDIYNAGFVLGALSLLLFFLGHLGLISPVYITAACAVAALLLIFAVLRRRIARDAYGGVSRPLSSLDIALVAVTVGFIFVIVALALTPPTVRDELIQHLALPKLYLARGRIYEIPFMGFSYLPLNIDMLYMIPLSFGNDIAPRLIHMGFAVLTGLLVYFYLLPGSGRTYALLGLLLYIATPLAANLSRMAYIDHGNAFFSTLALFAALRWRSEGFSTKWLVYSAVSMGLAFGSKYNAAISYLLIAMFILYAYSRDRGKSVGALKAVFIFSAIAFLIFSPWLVRNYIWRGNPFYPLWDSAMHAVSTGQGVHINGGMSPVAKRTVLYHEGAFDLLLLPLRIFWEGRDNSIRGFDGVLNPVYLAFIPLAFMKRRDKDGNIKFLALFSLLFLVLAFFAVDLVTRYLLPTLPLIVILVVLGFRNLRSTAKLAWLANLLMAALIVFDGAYMAGLYKRYEPLAYLSGAMTREQYLEKKLPDYKTVSYANRTLPKDALVMFLFTGDRGYYWERDYYYGGREGVFLKQFLKTSSSGVELLGKFTSTGATHLFIHEALLAKFINDNFSEREKKVLMDFFNGHTVRLYAANGFAIYALKKNHTAGPPRPGGAENKI